MKNIAIITFSFAFGIQIDMGTFNLTELTSSVSDFVAFMNSSEKPDPDWSVFEHDPKWGEAFKDTKPLGRVNL